MHKDAPAQNGTEKKKITVKRRWVIFAVVYLLVALFVAVIVHNKHLTDFLKLNVNALRPVLIGLLIAYVANPIYKFIHDNIFTWENRAQALRKTLCMVLSYVIIILFVTAFLMLILPQVTASINDLTTNFEAYMETTFAYVNDVLGKLPFEVPELSLDWLLSKFFKKDDMGHFIMPNFEQIMAQFGEIGASYVVALANILLDCLIGLFIAGYTLASKQRIAAQIRRILTALFHERGCKAILEFSRETDKTFGRYVVGKLTDSLLVIFLASIAFSLFRIPYAVLVGFIIGITNIIPFFGPILGAIPCGLLVFIAEPHKLITFIIILLIIQQIDANILDPLITGNATGISSLGVIIAVTVMGNYFGILGMVIGVPVTVSLLNLGKKLLDRRLNAEGLPTELDPYYPPKTDEVDKTSGEHIPLITATVHYFKNMYDRVQNTKKRAAEKKDAKKVASAEKKAAEAEKKANEAAASAQTDTQSDQNEPSESARPDGDDTNRPL